MSNGVPFPKPRQAGQKGSGMDFNGEKKTSYRTWDTKIDANKPRIGNKSSIVLNRRWPGSFSSTSTTVYPSRNGLEGSHDLSSCFGPPQLISDPHALYSVLHILCKNRSDGLIYHPNSARANRK